MLDADTQRKVVVEAVFSELGEYLVAIQIQTTDSQIMTRRGRVIVEAVEG